MSEVQAVILNLSFPQTLEDVLRIVTNDVFDIEALLSSVNCSLMHEWTVPKWIKPDDIVFFMHSKSSKHTIARLKNQLNRELELYKPSEVELITEGLKRGTELYSKYGGKIFSYGRVVENVQYNSDIVAKHWKSRIYAYVDDCCVLDNPIDLSEFGRFIKLSCGGSLTPVFGQEFIRLKNLISRNNNLKDYLSQSIAMPIPLSRINDTNWIDVASKYRRRFMYESQFRVFYVDYLLKLLGDKKTIYRECACKKEGIRTSFIDNVILFGKRYLPVEVKLSVDAEENIKSQLNKYCNLEWLCLDKSKDKYAQIDEVYNDTVLIIDTARICVFDQKSQQISDVACLDNIINIGDVALLRNELLNVLGVKPI